MLSKVQGKHVQGPVQPILSSCSVGAYKCTVEVITVIKPLNENQIQIFQWGILDILRFPSMERNYRLVTKIRCHKLSKLTVHMALRNRLLNLRGFPS